MKPQCETAAECLKELARVMEQFGIAYPLEAVNSVYVKFDNRRAYRDAMPTFDLPNEWQFAIAKVEGKPVFIGDELYTRNGEKCSAHETMVFDSYYSWNPPRPKTVMVEMTVEDAEFEVGKRQYTFDECAAYAGRKVEACKKALEAIK